MDAHARLGLARLLVGQRKVWLLDEPTVSLDALFWKPGCSSCLRTKEFLIKQGIEFESVNAEAGLRALGSEGRYSLDTLQYDHAWNLVKYVLGSHDDVGDEEGGNAEGGLTTQEIAQLLTRGNDAPDRVGAEAAVLALAAAGSATRKQLGDDALWRPAGDSSSLRSTLLL